MEEARAVNRTEANLTQEKIDFINTAYAEEVDYWKRNELESKNEDLAHSKVFLARKDAGKSRVENIYEMLFYLRNNYSPHTEERARINDIPQNDRFSFEEMSEYSKTFSKSVREVENMTLKNKVLLGGWIFFLITFKKSKNRHSGSITLTALVKPATHT